MSSTRPITGSNPYKLLANLPENGDSLKQQSRKHRKANKSTGATTLTETPSLEMCLYRQPENILPREVLGILSQQLPLSDVFNFNQAGSSFQEASLAWNPQYSAWLAVGDVRRLLSQIRFGYINPENPQSKSIASGILTGSTLSSMLQLTDYVLADNTYYANTISTTVNGILAIVSGLQWLNYLHHQKSNSLISNILARLAPSTLTPLATDYTTPSGLAQALQITGNIQQQLLTDTLEPEDLLDETRYGAIGSIVYHGTQSQSDVISAAVTPAPAPTMLTTLAAKFRSWLPWRQETKNETPAQDLRLQYKI